MVRGLFNANPVVYERKERFVRYPVVPADVDEYTVDPIDQLEVFDHIKNIRDPEHPSYSLEELKVVTVDAVEVNDKHSHVRVTFTPTQFSCPMVRLIGLCIRVKLMRCLPPRYKVQIMVSPGTHATEATINKRLNDKDRVAGALENPVIVQKVNRCLAPTFNDPKE